MFVQILGELWNYNKKCGTISGTIWKVIDRSETKEHIKCIVKEACDDHDASLTLCVHPNSTHMYIYSS